MESAVIKQIKRFGGETPKHTVNAVKLNNSMLFFLDAFHDLDTERTLSELNPIPWSKIVSYGMYYKLGPCEVDDLLYFIREADIMYLRRIAEKRKRV